MKIDPYSILGITKNATLEEIRTAFRSLAKKHHPDKGGSETRIVEINQAWEILKDEEKRRDFDNKYERSNELKQNKNNQSIKVEVKVKTYKSKLKNREKEITYWIESVYNPIDRLIGDIIRPLPQQLKDLSGDPYDDILMDSFCSYIQKSQKKVKKIKDIYQSKTSPTSSKQFALNLYQCFSEIQDALNEFEIYTQGYVDQYLHDGQEMIRIAKKKRTLLKAEKKKLLINQ